MTIGVADVKLEKKYWHIYWYVFKNPLTNHGWSITVDQSIIMIGQPITSPCIKTFKTFQNIFIYRLKLSINAIASFMRICKKIKQISLFCVF